MVVVVPYMVVGDRPQVSHDVSAPYVALPGRLWLPYMVVSDHIWFRRRRLRD